MQFILTVYIFTNNKNNSIFKDIKLDTFYINIQTFYSTFHNTNSYIILNINDIDKILPNMYNLNNNNFDEVKKFIENSEFNDILKILYKLN